MNVTGLESFMVLNLFPNKIDFEVIFSNSLQSFLKKNTHSELFCSVSAVHFIIVNMGERLQK